MIRRILLSLPLWLAYAAVELTLSAVGLVILLPMSALCLWTVRESKVADMLRSGGKPTLINAWRGGWLTWLWGNEEDGVIGPHWWIWERHPTWHARQLSYVWSALRNPVNNLRFVPGINPVIDPKLVQHIDWVSKPDQRDVLFLYTWQGVYSGLLVLFEFRGDTYRIWWGWKLKPEDRSGVPEGDMRKPRCGFAIQFKRIG